MRIHLHQTHHTLADFDAIQATLAKTFQQPGVHLYPELFLTGYPLADLCLQVPFVDAYEAFLSRLGTWLEGLPPSDNRVALVGALSYERGTDGVPVRIRNVALELVPGRLPREVYTKRLLPNYDIFDEQKYFTPGQAPGVWEWQDKRFALLICEDMWASSFHDLDPCADLVERGPFDAVFNLSASPWDVQKPAKRVQRARVLSHTLQAPFFYVNRVGGEDEILFDGRSFLVDGEAPARLLSAFAEADETFELPEGGPYAPPVNKLRDHTWESLFAPRFSENQSLPRQLHRWSDDECAQVHQALVFGLREYARKNGFRRYLVALSGGMDSALVLAIVKAALGPEDAAEAVYMPSIHSAPLSWDLAIDICERLRVPLRSLPIKFLHANTKMAFQTTFPDAFGGLTDENVQSRLRGLLLYTRSNQTGAMVVNTSNKSELAVGYSTQYGDSVGALSLLGDLYKCEVYRLAEWINATFGPLIPEGIITRAPSAELREGQRDQDSLPPYERLDAMLEGILTYRMGHAGLVAMGFAPDEVDRVLKLYGGSEYKRRQFCPIIKIKPKSFGFGYRIPLTKHRGFYHPRS